jgi:hypothetical protein
MGITQCGSHYSLDILGYIPTQLLQDQDSLFISTFPLLQEQQNLTNEDYYRIQ